MLSEHEHKQEHPSVWAATGELHSSKSEYATKNSEIGHIILWGYSIFSMFIQISWIGKVNVSGILNKSLTISSRLNNINCTFAK